MHAAPKAPKVKLIPKRLGTEDPRGHVQEAMKKKRGDPPSSSKGMFGCVSLGGDSSIGTQFCRDSDSRYD